MPVTWYSQIVLGCCLLIAQSRRATKDSFPQVLLKKGKKTAILLGRRVLLEDGLLAASQIAGKTGAKLFCEVFPTRLERGAGLPHVDRIG